MLKYFFYCLLWSLALLIPVAAFITIPAIVRRISNTNYHQSGHNILHSAEINGGFSISTTHHHQRNIVILCHNISLDVATGIFDVNNLLKGRIDVLARCVASALWVSNKIRTDTTFYCMLFPHNLTIEIQGSCVQSLTPDERTMALYLQRTLWSDGSKERREAEEEEQCADSSSLESLNQTLQRRTDINPQSAPMSNEKRIRDKRKGRDAMLHRIHIAHRGKSPLPGFILHHNDTLKSRLNKLESMWSSKDVDDSDRHLIYMLSENGYPLWNVLEEDTMQQQNKSNRGTNINNNNSHHGRRTTTLILGNQLGYSVEDEKFLLGEPTVREVSLGPLSLLASQCITITHHYLDRRFDDVITKRDTEI